jgi:hypothetical protein
MFRDGVRVRRDFESGGKLQADREQSFLCAVPLDHRDFGASGQRRRTVAPFQIAGSDHDVPCARGGVILWLFVGGNCK